MNVLQSSLMQSAHVRRYLKEEKIRSVVRHWPRVLRAIEEATLVALRVEEEEEEGQSVVYPLEVVAVSPELLCGRKVTLLAMEGECERHGYGIDEYYKASFCFQARDHVHALEWVGKALEVQPSNAVFLVLRGSALARAGQLKEACGVFKSVHDIDARYAKNYIRLGQALLERRKYESVLVSLHRGVEEGVFELPGVGMKLFELGRTALRELYGEVGSLKTIATHFGWEGPVDPNVWFRILDKLPVWNLLAFRQVCVSWNLLYKRYVKTRFGTSPAQWQADAKAKYGYKVLQIHRDAAVRFGYFFDQYLAEPSVVWARFLAFLESKGYEDPAYRFPLCYDGVICWNGERYHHFLYTLSAALCQRSLTRIWLLTPGDPSMNHFFIVVRVPGTFVYVGDHEPFPGEGDVRICEFSTEMDQQLKRTVNWDWNVRGRKGKNLNEIPLIQRHLANVTHPAKQPYNFAKAYPWP